MEFYNTWLRLPVLSWLFEDNTRFCNNIRRERENNPIYYILISLVSYKCILVPEFARPHKFANSVSPVASSSSDSRLSFKCPCSGIYGHNE